MVGRKASRISPYQSMHVTGRRFLASGGICLILILFATAIVYLHVTQRHEQIQRGDRLSALHARDLDGHSRQIASTSPRGYRVWIVLSPSCPICERELPLLDKTFSSGSVLPEVTVISLGGHTDTDRMTQGLTAVRMRTVVDESGDLERLYGRFGVPTMLVFDRVGRVTSKIVGQPADIAGAITSATQGGS